MYYSVHALSIFYLVQVPFVANAFVYRYERDPPLHRPDTWHEVLPDHPCVSISHKPDSIMRALEIRQFPAANPPNGNKDIHGGRPAKLIGIWGVRECVGLPTHVLYFYQEPNTIQSFSPEILKSQLPWWNPEDFRMASIAAIPDDGRWGTIPPGAVARKWDRIHRGIGAIYQIFPNVVAVEDLTPTGGAGPGRRHLEAVGGLALPEKFQFVFDVTKGETMVVPPSGLQRRPKWKENPKSKMKNKRLDSPEMPDPKEEEASEWLEIPTDKKLKTQATQLDARLDNRSRGRSRLRPGLNNEEDDDIDQKEMDIVQARFDSRVDTTAPQEIPSSSYNIQQINDGVLDQLLVALNRLSPSALNTIQSSTDLLSMPLSQVLSFIQDVNRFDPVAQENLRLINSISSSIPARSTNDNNQLQQQKQSGNFLSAVNAQTPAWLRTGPLTELQGIQTSRVNTSPYVRGKNAVPGELPFRASGALTRTENLDSLLRSYPNGLEPQARERGRDRENRYSQGVSEGRVKVETIGLQSNQGNINRIQEEAPGDEDAEATKEEYEEF